MLVRKSQALISVLFCLLLLAGCAQKASSSPPSSSPSSSSSFPTPSAYGNAVLSLDALSANKSVKPSTDFTGLSFELSQVCRVISLDQKNPKYYEQLYLNLGNGILHIGGHSADFGVWRPNGNMSCNASSTIVTQGMIRSLFAFVARIQWKVVWGLNLITYDPQSAAQEAAYIASVAGPSLLAFNFGNEPDLYAKHGWRPANWGYANYLSEWNAYYSDVRHLVPNAQFIGSDACCESAFFYKFLQDESGKIIAAGHHYYAGMVSTNKDYPSPNIPFLLSPYVLQQQTAFLAQWLGATRETNVSLDITETNTFAGGGLSGVSNTYASALWATDYLCDAAFLGVRRAEWQNAGRAAYNVIDDNGNPTPIYYGIFFFHMLVRSPGAAITSAGLQTTLNMTAYKVTDANATVHLVLINKDLTKNASVTIQLNMFATKAQLLRLLAPSPDATNNVSIGGKMLSAQETWSLPTNLESVDVKNNIAQVTVPSGSAVEVTFT
jgi:hypothetical protein